MLLALRAHRSSRHQPRAGEEDEGEAGGEPVANRYDPGAPSAELRGGLEHRLLADGIDHGRVIPVAGVTASAGCRSESSRCAAAQALRWK